MIELTLLISFRMGKIFFFLPIRARTSTEEVLLCIMKSILCFLLLNTNKKKKKIIFSHHNHFSIFSEWKKNSALGDFFFSTFLCSFFIKFIIAFHVDRKAQRHFHIWWLIRFLGGVGIKMVVSVGRGGDCYYCCCSIPILFIFTPTRKKSHSLLCFLYELFLCVKISSWEIWILSNFDGDVRT